MSRVEAVRRQTRGTVRRTDERTERLEEGICGGPYTGHLSSRKMGYTVPRGTQGFPVMAIRLDGSAVVAVIAVPPSTFQ